MRRRELLAAIPVASGLAGCAEIRAMIPESEGESRPRHKVIEETVFEEANEARAEQEIPELEFNEQLYEAARSHSLDMAEKGYFAHEPPDGTRNRNYCAENIGRMGDPGAEAKVVAGYAVSGWLSSPGHRKNLLNPFWGAMAIGAAVGEEWIYVTQDFC